MKIIEAKALVKKDLERFKINRHWPVIWQKTKKNIFCTNDGWVGFHSWKNYLLVAGEPLSSSEDEMCILWSDFSRWAKEQNKLIAGYYISENLAELVGQLPGGDLDILPIGSSVEIDLKKYSLDGAMAEESRRALNVGEREHFSFEIIRNKQPYLNAVLDLEKRWIKSKPMKRIGFLLSKPELGFPLESEELWVIALHEGQPLAFLSLINMGDDGIYLDNMIYDPQKNRFGLSFLIVQMAIYLKKKSHSRFYLGLCPGSLEKADSLFDFSLVTGAKLFPFYNFTGLYNFKKKFSNQTHRRYGFVPKQGLRVNHLFNVWRASFTK